MFRSIYFRMFTFLIKASVYILMAAVLTYPNMYIWNKLIVTHFSFTSVCNFQQTFLVLFAWFMFASDPFDVVYTAVQEPEHFPDEEEDQ